MKWGIILDFTILLVLVVIGFMAGWTVWNALWTGVLIGMIYTRHVENKLLGLDTE